MADETIRIGFVGAGANTRLRHIPGFKAMPGVELVSVANRSRASGQRVADEYRIPAVYESWQKLIRADDTNATTRNDVNLDPCLLNSTEHTSMVGSRRTRSSENESSP